MTIDEILEALKAIIDGAEGRELTDEEVARYETLEADLAVKQRDYQIRSRNAAYQTVAPAVHVATPKTDDTLERAFTHYLRTGQANSDLTELRAQSESGSAAGGYLVPTEFQQKIVERMVSFGGFAPNAENISTGSGNPIEFPTLDDTANLGDITAESAAVASGADLSFGKLQMGAYKYTSAGAGSNLPLRVSVELLQDSAFDIAGLVSRAMGTRIARKQAPHWITGTGVGQPQGILSPGLTADRDLDTADAVDYEDLVDLTDLLDEAYEPNAKWLMKKNTWSQIRLLVDLSGRPLIQSSTDGISGKPTRTLLGAEVIIDQAVPTLSSAGDTFCIAYGDFREAYLIRRVSNLTVVVDPYSRASYGEVEYTAWERADGIVQNRNAYVILQNNT